MGGERAEVEDVEQVSPNLLYFIFPQSIFMLWVMTHHTCFYHSFLTLCDALLTHCMHLPPRFMSRSRLEAEGYAVFGLTGAEDGVLYRDAIVRMYIPGMPLPYHCFSRVRPPVGWLVYEYITIGRGEGWIPFLNCIRTISSSPSGRCCPPDSGRSFWGRCPRRR